MHSLDLNLVAALEALLDERHVTRAGDRLRLSQSAMSGILRRLRSFFGDEILVRSGRELILTPFAESLIPLVREARQSTDRLLSYGAEFQPETSSRTFSIAASDFAQAATAPSLAVLLSDVAPHVRVNFVPHPPELLREPQVTLLKYDLIILPAPFLAAYSRTSEVLFEDTFSCVISASHPAARDGALSLADLARIPTVSTSAGHTHPDAWTLGGAQLSRSDVDLAHPTIDVSSYLAVIPILRAGGHWALLPSRLAAAECSGSDWLVFEPPFDTEPFAEAVFWHASRSRDPELAWLRQTLRAALGDAARPNTRA